MKYIIILAVFLALGWYFTFDKLSIANDKINALESEKNALQTTIERYKNAQVESNRTIQELRKISQAKKSNMDWYNTPIPDEFIKLLQKRHNRTLH